MESRWCIVLAVFLGSGCLDALADDDPGYSRHLLPADANVPDTAKDYEANHKIDLNDGVSEGTVSLSAAYADGRAVQYWDLGLSKSSITPVYVLSECDSAGMPVEGGLVAHPPLFGSAPGDADYSPFRSVYTVCIKDRYAGERITSLEALSDAIDMKLVEEPSEPTLWANFPIVAAGVQLDVGGPKPAATHEGYYQERRVGFLDLASQEGHFAYMDKRIKAPNVYELSRAGEEGVAQVVFAQALLDAEGKPNGRYAPAVKVVAVTLASEADLTQFTSEAQIVSIDDEGKLTPASELVLSAEPTGDTMNRPQQIPEAP